MEMAENPEIITNDAERKAALETLRASYQMYNNSIENMKEVRMNKTDKQGNRIYSDESVRKTTQLMQTMQKDIKNKFLALGGTEEELEAPLKKGKNAKRAVLEGVKAKKMTADERKKNLKYLEEAKKYADVLNKYAEQSKQQADLMKANMEEIGVPQEIDHEVPEYVTGPKGPEESFMTPEMDERLLKPVEKKSPKVAESSGAAQSKAYDMVKLPSGGECYPDKMKEIKVAHLVAYDENLILSPNLYRDGTFLDHILKNKIMDPVDPDYLVQGDRDAIIIWLRAGGYGPLYPIRMRDEETGEEYDTQVDLSQLKFKKFKLKGDENGHFDFTTPVSGDVIKFRFLTAGDVKILEDMKKTENQLQLSNKIKADIREIRSFIEESDKFTDLVSDTLLKSLERIEDAVYEEYEDVLDSEFSHDLTNRLILSTVSVNGVEDRKYIANYIMNMSIKDATEFRKYIVENEPGIDYNVKVKRPDSLGGGYIDTFLQLDQFIFVY